MIGVDLGTTNVRIHVKGKGVMLREPAVIAVNQNTGEVKAVGQEAYLMLGRTPGNIVASRPMADGVIGDYTLTAKLLQSLLRKVITGFSKFFKPNIMVCIPSGITDVERRAVVQALHEVGASKAYLIEEPIAAAIGAGINIADPVGSMVIDIGGGTTDIAVISLGGIVLSKGLRIAGNQFDQEIVEHVRKRYSLLIGERTAEELKREIGAAMMLGNDNPGLVIRGRDLITGLPKTIEVYREDVVAALTPSLDKIAADVRKMLEGTPPELISDVIERGIVMTGGGAMLEHFDTFLSRITGVPVVLAEEAEDCVVFGTAAALEMVDTLKDTHLTVR